MPPAWAAVTAVSNSSTVSAQTARQSWIIPSTTQSKPDSEKSYSSSARISKKISAKKYSVNTKVSYPPKLPEGYTCPADRTKPWGTNHAVLMGKEAIKEPFAVINADDFYGRDAFRVIAEELQRPHDRKGDYCMVGFRVGNTMTENGSVARGVCQTKEGLLTSVVERTAISYDNNHNIVFTDENGEVQTLEPNTPVSMNLWGFTPDYFDYSEREFKKFLDRDINTPKAEFFIPLCIDTLINSKEATVKVLDTDSKWFGVTYSADRPGVVEKFAELHREGVYPTPLFKKN